MLCLSWMVEYRGMYKLLRDESVAILAREKMFYVSAKNFDGRLLVN